MSAFEVQPLSRQELAEGEPVSSRPSRRSSSPMPSSFRASPSFRDEPGLVDPLPPPRLDELGGTPRAIPPRAILRRAILPRATL